jgi:hypothetical protein
MLEVLKTIFNFLYNHPTYRVGAIFLILVVVVLSIYLTPKLKDQRANFVLGSVIVALLLMIIVLPPGDRWQWIVGLLPTLMVGYQLFFLWFNHPKQIDAGSPGGVDRAGQPPQLKVQSYRRAQDTINSHFSLKTLFTRYGLPAVLLGITGIVVSSILIDPDSAFSVYVNTMKANQGQAAERILLGLRLGAVGAYVYILLELGRRTFRHDITGALAMWCWVTLVLGPVLAATVAFLWHIDPAPSGAGWWGSGVVLFFTGFAPRRVIAAIEQAASELLKAGPSATVQSRVIPLSQIRGIDAQIEERLDEEGVYDVNTLAAAEPVRLVRNTPFDMRQILNWIDEAILIVTLPRSWQALEEEGVTGAIDLAWYYDEIVYPKTREIRDPLPPAVATLAEKSKLDPTSLVTTIQRLSEDTQVQYIWALYNNFTEYSGGEPDSPNNDDGGKGDPVKKDSGGGSTNEETMNNEQGNKIPEQTVLLKKAAEEKAPEVVVPDNKDSEGKASEGNAPAVNTPGENVSGTENTGKPGGKVDDSV